MSAVVRGYSRDTIIDAFYTDDSILGGQTGDMHGGWPFDHAGGVDVAMEVGELISVTVNMWARSADPDIRIGRYELPLPSTFVDDTASWVALDAYREGDWWSKTWYRAVTQAMIDYEFVDVAILQSSVNTGEGGVDGGELYVVGWRDARSLHNVYGLPSTGTVHTPGTSDYTVANFYVGGGGYSEADALDSLPTITGAAYGDEGFTQVVGGDNNLGAPTFDEEYFGVGFYQPTVAPVGHWETPTSQDALLVGIGATSLSTIAASVGAGGILRHKSIIG